jgi:hypothetical protein
VAQTGQWRTAQRIEALSARSALVALQSVSVPVSHDLCRPTIRATGMRLQATLDHLCNNPFTTTALQMQNQLRSLINTERIQQSHQPLELMCIHIGLQGS